MIRTSVFFQSKYRMLKAGIVGSVLLLPYPSHPMDTNIEADKEVHPQIEHMIRAHVQSIFQETVFPLVQNLTSSKNNVQDGFDVSAIKSYISQIIKIYFPWGGYKPSPLGGIALAGIFAV